jgi:hypothetical protein
LLSGCLRFWFKGRCGVTLKGGLLLWLKPKRFNNHGDDDVLLELKIKTLCKKTFKNLLTEAFWLFSEFQ